MVFLDVSRADRSLKRKGRQAAGMKDEYATSMGGFEGEMSKEKGTYLEISKE